MTRVRINLVTSLDGYTLWDDLRGVGLTHKLTTEVAGSGTIHVTFAR